MVDKKASKAPKEVSKKKKKVFKSPSAFAVLFVIIAFMAGLTWVIPSGKYERAEKDGREYVVSGTYKEIPKEEEVVGEDGKPTGETTDLRQGVWDIFMSPIKGMTSRLDVIIFILILGGFLGIVMKTQALDSALGGLLVKMKGREKWLIPILMTLFAIGGTTYGMQEEAVAFYALVIPVMLAAGYNAMTAVMVIVLGAGSGVLASTVNPFSTGIAAKAAEIKLGGVLLPQLVIFVLTLAAAIFFTMRYAAKVKAGKYKDDASTSKFKTLDLSNIPKFTIERKFIMGIFAVTFLIMVISLIPWEADFGITIFKDFHNYLVSLPLVGAIFGFGHAVPFGDWYFNEISALFLISSALMAIVYREEFKKTYNSTIDVFLAGVADLMSVAFIIAVAAAIGEVMNAGGIQDTIVYWGENLLKGTHSGIVGILAFIFYIPMSFIIPSSSGLAAASMPVIAPVVELVGANKEVAVVAFATASGLLNMIAPTIASLLAGLSIAGVPYQKWVKRVAPIMVAFTLISLAVIFTMGIIK